MSAMSSPAVAPQQTIADRKGRKWIEIKLIDQDKQPVAHARFELKLPDGTIRSGRLDDDGSHVAQAVPEGNCEVRFPDFDADSWKPA
jgi:type VI secretion system secreted protein VgrG